MPSNNGRAQAHETTLREIFDRGSLAETRTKIDARQAVYASGDEDDSLYLIESGQVKLSMASAAGKDCLLAIYTAGEVFGESCFTGSEKRFESAIAMRPTIVRRVSRRDLVVEIERAGAWEILLRHMAARLAERQASVFELVTMASDRRLGKVLLTFAEKLGTIDGALLRLGQRVSHEELSQIIGTTRPRVTEFMKRFRARGFVRTDGRSISVHRNKLREWLARD
jgi:CRP/FNR family transcriptional regulator, cyclic AMP receptor protein